MPTTDLSHWDRFLLLLWKNGFLLWHNRKQMIFLFTMPLIIGLPLMVFRYSIDPIWNGEHIYQPIDLDAAWKELLGHIEQTREKIKSVHPEFEHSVFVPQMVIGYAPNSYIDTEELLTGDVNGITLNLDPIGFPNCRVLEETQKEENYFVGICFHGFEEQEEGVEGEVNFDKPSITEAQILNFSLILPMELRYLQEKKSVGDNWQTNRQFDYNRANERQLDANDGGYIGYIREGFILIQMIITHNFLSMVDVTMPTINIQRFPEFRSLSDRMKNIFLSAPLLILCGFLIPVLTFIYLITREKESEIKMYVKALGVPNFVLFCAWYVVGLFLFFSNAVIIFATLKLPWLHNYAILTATNSMCLLMILFAYSFATTGFCIFMSSFSEQCIMTVAWGGIMWIITFVPFISVIDNDWVFYVCLNTIMATVIEVVREYELLFTGMQFRFLFDPQVETHRRCGVCILLFILQGIVYLLLALLTEWLVPKIMEKIKTCNNFLTKAEKRRGEVINRRVSSLVDPLSSRVSQVEPLYKKQLVSLEHVYKVYGKNEVVRDVNLNLYENDITILMGHNGCGKTSLLSLVLGIKTHTEGEIVIENFNLKEYRQLACSNLGGCLKTYLLYDDLTVENQIKFFSRLKGCTWKQAKNEVEKYCRQMQLAPKRKTLTSALTVGMKQQLAVCCAFAGNSKIVILDEPTFGMDFSAAQLVVNLVENEKRNRAIFWSTNSIEIANTISDRIAVMAGGEIVCSGSITFLRNMYNNGRSLVLTKGDFFKRDKATKFLQQYIPDIQLDSDMMRSVAYTCHETYSHKIADALVALEKELVDLSITSYAVDDISIREVVLNMGSDYPHDIDPKRKQRVMRGETMYSEDNYKHFEIPNEDVKFRKLQAYKALFKTRVYFHKHHKWLFLSQLFFPVILTIIMFTNSTESGGIRKLTPLSMELDNFPKSIVLLGKEEVLDVNTQSVVDEYPEIVYEYYQEHTVRTVDSADFNEEVFSIQETNKIVFERQYIVGATFNADAITVYFNNFPLHSAPVTLNLLYNALGRQNGKYYRIFVHFKPVLYNHELATIPVFTDKGGFYNFIIMLILTSLITWSNSVYDLTKSTDASFKHLLIINGASIFDFWFVTFCFDFVRTVILVTAVTLTLLACLTVNVANSAVLAVFYIFLLMGGICTFSVQYVLAKLIKSDQICFRTVLLFASVGIGLFILENEVFPNEHSPERDYLLLHPYYALGDGLLEIFVHNREQSLCSNEDVSYFVEQHPNSGPKCDGSFFDMENGVGKHILSFLITIFLAWTLIFVLENAHRYRHFWIFAIKRDESESVWEDHIKLHDEANAHKTVDQENSVRERILVDTMKPQEAAKVYLTVDRLGKIFGITEALHRFSFYLDKCVICGILGLNGAGKSVLLKILSNEMTQSYGAVVAFGNNPLTHARQIFPHVGYCPQVLDSLLDYTPAEILYIFANIRGIPKYHIEKYCESVAKLVGFYEYYDRQLVICSEGTVKRVGAAIALIGSPMLIYMDEPLSAIDIHGKLILYNLMNRLCRAGRSVLFTSLSPMECQSICNKTVIMLDGRIIESGQLSDIYKSTEICFVVKIRLKPLLRFDDDRDISKTDVLVTRVVALVQTSFSNSSFRSAEGNMLTFTIPTDQDIGAIFSLLRNNSFSFNIESFGVNRLPLDTLYLNIVNRSKQAAL